MAAKITFDLVNRRIIVNSGVTTLNVQTDLYSDAKEDWLTNTNGEMNLIFPFRAFGSDPLGGELLAGAYFFLRNDLGWRIRPQEADHELVVTGNLYGESASLPLFVPTLGDYTATIRLSTSSLTQVVHGLTTDQIWEQTQIETGFSPAAILRLIAAVLLSQLQRVGAIPYTAIFRSITGHKIRVEAEVDQQMGSRDITFLDGD